MSVLRKTTAFLKAGLWDWLEGTEESHWKHLWQFLMTVYVSSFETAVPRKGIHSGYKKHETITLEKRFLSFVDWTQSLVCPFSA